MRIPLPPDMSRLPIGHGKDSDIPTGILRFACDGIRSPRHIGLAFGNSTVLVIVYRFRQWPKIQQSL